MRLRKSKSKKEDKPLFSERDKEEFFKSFACKKMFSIVGEKKIKNNVLYDQTESDTFELLKLMKCGKRKGKSI